MSYDIYSQAGADAKFLTEVDGGNLDAAPLPITLRRGTTAERNASNPIIAAGEPAVVLDSGQPAELVLGDGVTAMADLRAAVWDDDARLALAGTATQPGDLGTAAAADVGDFATAGQGAKADTAVQPARTITAGTGLTGGGDLSANRTLTVAYGTTSTTATVGNDSRVTGAAQKSANLSDLANTATARTNLGLGTAATTAATAYATAAQGATADAALAAAAAPELIRDTMATALVAGANVTITPNDGADTITIAASGGGGGGAAFEPRRRQTWGYASTMGAGYGWAGEGTTTGTASSTDRLTLTSAATPGSRAEVSAVANQWVTATALPIFEVKAAVGSTSNIRFWAGLGVAGMTNTDNVGFNGGYGYGRGAAIRYSTVAGDTTFKYVITSAAGTQVVDSGVTGDTAVHVFTVEFLAADQIRFSIDGAAVQTITASAAIDNTMYGGVTVFTQDSVAKSINPLGLGVSWVVGD